MAVNLQIICGQPTQHHSPYSPGLQHERYNSIINILLQVFFLSSTRLGSKKKSLFDTSTSFRKEKKE